MKNLDVAHLVTGVTTEDDFDAAVSAYEGGDLAKAATLFQKLADNGDPESQINLARMILEGKVANTGKVDACKLLSKAAASGNDEAASELDALKATLTPAELSAVG